MDRRACDLLFLLSLSANAVACGDDAASSESTTDASDASEDDERFEMLCQAYADNAQACGRPVFMMNEPETVMEECIGYADVVESRGPECVEVLADLLACLSTLDCAKFPDVGHGESCAEEAVAFDDICG